MVKTLFNGMVMLMQEYITARDNHTKKLDEITGMNEYSEWKKDELRAEAVTAFKLRKEKLISDFTDRVERVKRLMQEAETALDLSSTALSNAMLFFNSLPADSEPKADIIKEIADNFAGDSTSLRLLLTIAESKGVDALSLAPIKEMIYSEEAMDDLLVKYTNAVDGTLMIRRVAKDLMTAAKMCGVILEVPEISDEIGENDFARRVMGLASSAT